jgi:hypothetical protein
MGRPVRLQLSRRKGFDLQALSMATNGLPAVNVARPGKWGNPFKVGVDGTALECVELFRHEANVHLGAPTMGLILRNRMGIDLAGKNLACWCAIGAPCHADVLLDLATPPEQEGEG